MNISQSLNAEDIKLIKYTLKSIAKKELEDPSKYLLNINAKNSKGFTALHTACMNPTTPIEKIEFLLENGADPNASAESTGWTPLHMASRFSGGADSLEVIELLLKNGAYPNASANDGWTPLHLASRNSGKNSLKVIKLLLRNNADPNASNIDDWTPLHMVQINSTSTNSLEIFELLLRNGATPINRKTQIVKLEMDINNLMQDNEELKRRIEILELDED